MWFKFLFSLFFLKVPTHSPEKNYFKIFSWTLLCFVKVRSTSFILKKNKKHKFLFGVIQKFQASKNNFGMLKYNDEWWMIQELHHTDSNGNLISNACKSLMYGTIQELWSSIKKNRFTLNYDSYTRWYHNYHMLSNTHQIYWITMENCKISLK